MKPWHGALIAAMLAVSLMFQAVSWQMQAETGAMLRSLRATVTIVEERNQVIATEWESPNGGTITLSTVRGEDEPLEVFQERHAIPQAAFEAMFNGN